MMEKKRIGVIGLKGLPAFGGAASVGENIITELSKTYQFTVYAVSSHTTKHSSTEHCRQIVFDRFFIKKLNIFIYYVKSLLHALFKDDFDVIHLHHIDGAFILPWLRLKYKVIVTAHAQPQLAEKWSLPVKLFFSMNEKIAIWLANEFTCVSKKLYMKYKNQYNRNFIFIPNGIHRQILSHDIPVKEKNYILFSAGRIIPLKGLHLLLEALNEMAYMEKIIVLGDLEQMRNYKKKIVNLSERLNITFTGLIRDKAVVSSYLKMAKLFVFPSYSENMSMMLLEAAVMKTPIICSDIKENKDIFSEDEVTFFRSEDVNDLKDKIFFALTHNDLMIQKTEKAFKHLIEHFLWDTIADQYAQVYQKVIN